MMVNDSKWHKALNDFNTGKKFNHWMYEAKAMFYEIPRLALLFKAERIDNLPKVHQQCSRQEPVKLKENYLTCCLGKKCLECEFLKPFDDLEIEPEQIDQIKAYTCTSHILHKCGEGFVDTSEGYLLTVDDRLFWDSVHQSLGIEE